MKIGMAYTAGLDPDQDFTRSRLGRGDFRGFDGLSNFTEDSGSHLFQYRKSSLCNVPFARPGQRSGLGVLRLHRHDRVFYGF